MAIKKSKISKNKNGNKSCPIIYLNMYSFIIYVCTHVPVGVCCICDHGCIYQLFGQLK